MTEELIKWDYRVQTFGSMWSNAKAEDIEAALIEWGVDGWEVVGTIHKSTNEAMVIAKRPLTHAIMRARSMPSS